MKNKVRISKVQLLNLIGQLNSSGQAFFDAAVVKVEDDLLELKTQVVDGQVVPLAKKRKAAPPPPPATGGKDSVGTAPAYKNAEGTYCVKGDDGAEVSFHDATKAMLETAAAALDIDVAGKKKVEIADALAAWIDAQ